MTEMVHALALGTGRNVELLDETSCPTEQKIRCTGRWLQVEGFRDRALDPVRFLREGDGERERCASCLRIVQDDHRKALKAGYSAMNALADLERKGR